MNGIEITKQLVNKHIDFIDYLNSLSKEEYDFSFENKWTAGQQAEHILKSINVLKKAFSYPKFVLKYKFGVTNRPSKTFDELITKYLMRLKNAPPTPKRFEPSTTNFNHREVLTKQIIKAVQKLNNKVEKVSEEKLDYYILPHPLLGYQTLREMLYFTIFHVQQHQGFIKRNCKSIK
jgi:hypothetical protein